MFVYEQSVDCISMMNRRILYENAGEEHMNEIYQNPLIERYSSEEMLQIFSPMNKFSNWRKLWIALAECEKELGLNITDEIGRAHV